MEPAEGSAILHGLFQQESSMRKIMLTSVCAAVLSLSGFAAASAQTAGAPANSQTASPAATDTDSMNAMNKSKKKTKAKKDTKMDTKTDSGAMEKK
jgi:hypothetical protein